jgi:hypothetical protein
MEGGFPRAVASVIDDEEEAMAPDKGASDLRDHDGLCGFPIKMTVKAFRSEDRGNFFGRGFPITDDRARVIGPCFLFSDQDRSWESSGFSGSDD